MSVDYGTSSGVRRRSFLGIVALPLLAFLLGIAAMAWLLTRWDAAAELLGIRPAAPVTAAQPIVGPLADPLAAPAPAVRQPQGPEPQRFIIDPETTRRVALLDGGSATSTTRPGRLPETRTEPKDC
jgi:hypothetical protein